MKKRLMGLLIVCMSLSGCNFYGDGGYPWSGYFQPPATPCASDNSSCSW